MSTSEALFFSAGASDSLNLPPSESLILIIAALCFQYTHSLKTVSKTFIGGMTFSIVLIDLRIL